MAYLLTQNYAKKNNCRNESLIPGLTLTNFLKPRFPE